MSAIGSPVAFPCASPLLWPRRLLGLSNRKLTPTGLLEYHYEKYLYGDTSLFELPERPELHILATNLSEGCLCSFNRNGLLMMHRQPGNAVRMERIHVGLATVPMAVTASSAFPGFFPPVELTGADVGAIGGEFGRQSYTDGGVFDNLGVRMFRCLERPLLAETPLSCDDFVDFQAVVETLCAAGKSSEETPFRRLGQIMVAACSRPDLLSLTGVEQSGGAGLQPISGPGQLGSQTPLPSSKPEVGNGDGQEIVLPILWDVLRHYQLQREPLFAGLKPEDPDAEALLHASRSGGRVLEACDQAWLNRHLLEAAFRQATGRSLLPQTQQRAGRHPRQRCGKAIRGSGQPPRRWADPDRPTFDRHRHGSGLAARDRDVPGLAQLRLRPDYRGGRAGRRPHGVASGDPAAGGQHPHGLRSLFASGNQQPGATRILCWSQGMPDAPRPVWS